MIENSSSKWGLRMKELMLEMYRKSKVKQKTSGGFRAPGGSESYSRIQNFISTLRKQNRQVFQELWSVIAGNPSESFRTYSAKQVSQSFVT